MDSTSSMGYSVNIEGSVHKGSVSIYFRFWVFTPFDRSRRVRQACDVSFSNFATQCHESYKPSKNGAICNSAYLLCAQRFYRSAIFDRTFVPTLIALCVADRSGTKVLCANFVANSILQRAQRFYLAR